LKTETRKTTRSYQLRCLV